MLWFVLKSSTRRRRAGKHGAVNIIIPFPYADDPANKTAGLNGNLCYTYYPSAESKKSCDVFIRRGYSETVERFSYGQAERFHADNSC